VTDLSRCISWSKGSSQPWVHSQWASKNVSTSPLARAAPVNHTASLPVAVTADSTITTKHSSVRQIFTYSVGQYTKFCRSPRQILYSQSKRIYIAPCVASKSEAWLLLLHIAFNFLCPLNPTKYAVFCRQQLQWSVLLQSVYQINYWQCFRIARYYQHSSR